MNDFAGTASTEEAKSIYRSSLGREYGEFMLGSNTTKILWEDPKLLLFTLARYKFVSKMFSGMGTVLEIGCQEAWGLPLVANEVRATHGIDFYVPYIESCKRRIVSTRMTFQEFDILDGPLPTRYDGVFALDVLEHIAKSSEDSFMRNAVGSLDPSGTLILGMPSLESQAYASEASKIGHVNCKSGAEFTSFARQYFDKVLTFCMNDEVLHTGFFPMAHYLFVVCSQPKE